MTTIKLSDYILEQSVSDASISDIEIERLFAEMDVCLAMMEFFIKEQSMRDIITESATTQPAMAQHQYDTSVPTPSSAYYGEPVPGRKTTRTEAVGHKQEPEYEPKSIAQAISDAKASSYDAWDQIKNTAKSDIHNVVRGVAGDDVEKSIDDSGIGKIPVLGSVVKSTLRNKVDPVSYAKSAAKWGILFSLISLLSVLGGYIAEITDPEKYKKFEKAWAEACTNDKGKRHLPWKGFFKKIFVMVKYLPYLVHLMGCCFQLVSIIMEPDPNFKKKKKNVENQPGYDIEYTISMTEFKKLQPDLSKTISDCLELIHKANAEIEDKDITVDEIEAGLQKCIQLTSTINQQQTNATINKLKKFAYVGKNGGVEIIDDFVLDQPSFIKDLKMTTGDIHKLHNELRDYTRSFNKTFNDLRKLK